MIKAVIRLLAFAAICATPLAVSAKDKDNAGVVQLRVAPAALRTDAAYILLRTSTAKTGIIPIQHVMLRIPSATELNAYRVAKHAAYDAALPELTRKAKGGKVTTFDQFGFDYQGKANSFVVINSAFLEDGAMRTILLEVPPGKYVLYGITMGAHYVVTCNCLGTLSFEAPAGVITDVGSLYADKVHKPSPVPHLEDNLGPQMFQYGVIFGEALVRPDAGTPVPQSLRALAIEPANFEVVGEFYEPGSDNVNRLAPIPGLLGYQRGRAVDLRQAKAAE